MNEIIYGIALIWAIIMFIAYLNFRINQLERLMNYLDKITDEYKIKHKDNQVKCEKALDLINGFYSKNYFLLLFSFWKDVRKMKIEYEYQLWIVNLKR